MAKHIKKLVQEIDGVEYVVDTRAIVDALDPTRSLQDALNLKQKKLTAGTGINIDINGVISCTIADGNDIEY